MPLSGVEVSNHRCRDSARTIAAGRYVDVGSCAALMCPALLRVMPGENPAPELLDGPAFLRNGDLAMLDERRVHPS